MDLGFDNLVRSLVNDVAFELVESLMVRVTLYRWIGHGSQGEPTYAAAKPMMAVVDMQERLRKKVNGEVIMQKAQLTFKPIPSLNATGRHNPIDPRDKFVLPNGYTGPILDVIGPVDPQTNAPYVLDVILG